MRSAINGLLISAFLCCNFACEEEFAQRSHLEGLRILAITTDPIEASITDRSPMILTPFVVSTSSSSLKHEWHFCPLTLGARVGYACAISECETSITPDTRGRILFRPGQAAAKCLERLSNRSTEQESMLFDDSTEIPDKIETVFRYTVRDALGAQVDAIARVPLWIQGPAENPNQAIRIRQVMINGVATSSTAKEIEVDRLDSIDIQVSLDESSIESDDDPLISFFATEGRFDAERVLGGEATNTLKVIESTVTKLELYIVARDGRGSQAVFGGLVLKKTP
jgi:hypothetical protein